MLIGRTEECEQIAAILDKARSGRCQALVVRGDAGIGKTAILRYAKGLAQDMTVVSATGIEAEAELEFSGLLELCRPLLRHIDSLTEFQADALRGALGLAAPTNVDRFVVGAATLELVAAAAEERPILVVVDDAQWLDRASAQALAFAARRMHADRVAFLFAVRDELLVEDGQETAGLDARGAPFDTAGLPELRLKGLTEADTRQLLTHVARCEPAAEVVARLHRETGGNPLALIELVDSSTPAELETASTIAGPIPVGERIRRAFADRVAALPDDVRRAALIVAAATEDSAETIGRALAVAGLGIDVLAQAERAGIVTVAVGRVSFRHPLVRSAVYEAADAGLRRSAHQCLAQAMADDGDPERRTWHLCQAALGPDESVAAALAETARRAQARTGYLAAAVALEHAARLSPEEGLRLDRLAEAARMAFAAGDPARALRLADEGLASAREPSHRAALLLVKGEIATSSEPSHAHELLVEAAEAVTETDPVTAARALSEAGMNQMFLGLVQPGLRHVRRARELAPRDGSPADIAADYALGRLLFTAGLADEGEPMLRRAVDALLGGAGTAAELAQASVALAILGEDEQARRTGQRVVEMARGRHPALLAFGLGVVMHIDTWWGHWQEATAAGAEAVALLRDLGYRNSVVGVVLQLATIDAMRGREDACLAAIAEAEALDFGRSHTQRSQADFLRGRLALSLGRWEEAAEWLGAVAEWIAQTGWHDRDTAPEPDLVEIHVRLGNLDEARAHYENWLRHGARSSPAWGAAQAARCAALLAPDAGFDDEFARAVRLLANVRDAFTQARTQLCYGERLRRLGRKREAREQLRAALETFERLAAPPWAERARAELRATGEKIRSKASTDMELTPQERQIALQVAEGRTNKEVAAALFLSPKTVEFHLSRVFRKLGIGSRAELIRRLAVEAG